MLQLEAIFCLNCIKKRSSNPGPHGITALTQTVDLLRFNGQERACREGTKVGEERRDHPPPYDQFPDPPLFFAYCEMNIFIIAIAILCIDIPI